MEDFNKLLEEYSGNYVQFLTTGLPDYERAYKNARNSIEKILLDKRERVDKEKRDMKHFANSYKEDNDELSNIFDSASTMYKDAQTIEDSYETSKQRYKEFTSKPETPKAVDVSNGYQLLLRIGIILILIPILFLLGFYLMSASSGSAVETLGIDKIDVPE